MVKIKIIETGFFTFRNWCHAFINSNVSNEDSDVDSDVDDDDDKDSESDDADDEDVDEKRAVKLPHLSNLHNYKVVSDFRGEEQGDLSVQVCRCVLTKESEKDKNPSELKHWENCSSLSWFSLHRKNFIATVEGALATQINQCVHSPAGKIKVKASVN